MIRRWSLLSLLKKVLILAIIAYIGTAAVLLILEREESALVPEPNIEIIAPITGIFLRDEQVLPYRDNFLPEIYEGKKLSSGAISDYSGIFTASLDGYEHITSLTLEPQAIMQAMQDKRIVTSSVGKIITSSETRFYAIIESEYVENLQIMSKYVIKNEKYGDIELKLCEIGDSFEHFTAILFSTNEQMRSIIEVRQISGTMGM